MEELARLAAATGRAVEAAAQQAEKRAAAHATEIGELHRRLEASERRAREVAAERTPHEEKLAKLACLDTAGDADGGGGAVSAANVASEVADGGERWEREKRAALEECSRLWKVELIQMADTCRREQERAVEAARSEGDAAAERARDEARDEAHQALCDRHADEIRRLREQIDGEAMPTRATTAPAQLSSSARGSTAPSGGVAAAAAALYVPPAATAATAAESGWNARAHLNIAVSGERNLPAWETIDDREMREKAAQQKRDVRNSLPQGAQPPAHALLRSDSETALDRRLATALPDVCRDDVAYDDLAS